jgi:putative Mg2+ transporter-C (MgtC) family protein
MFGELQFYLQGSWEALMESELMEVLSLTLISCLCGGLIGFERESRGKAAGIRTMMLISGGATLFALISKMSVTFEGGAGDTSRVIAQIVTGVGFLGAGAIIHSEEGAIVGLTTASTVWMVAAIGVVIGLGRVATGISVSLLLLLILLTFERVEMFIRSNEYRPYRLTVTFEKARSNCITDVNRALNEFGVHNSQLVALRQEGEELKQRPARQGLPLEIEVQLRFPTRRFQAFLARLHAIDGVSVVEVAPMKKMAHAQRLDPMRVE